MFTFLYKNSNGTDEKVAGNELCDNGRKHKQVLSLREAEVLGLVATGMTGAKIATKLFVSLNTVESHKRSIIKKMIACNMVHAVVKAMRMGLVE